MPIHHTDFYYVPLAAVLALTYITRYKIVQYRPKSYWTVGYKYVFDSVFSEPTLLLQ